jgi:enoyl-CoA hydratase/carnithine racemase
MSDQFEFITTESHGNVFVLTIDRPAVMNAIHPPACHEMARAWDAFAADDDLWVGVVTGSGEKAFSAGNDLKHQASGGDMSWPASGFGGLTARFDCDKPLIAAVNGLALGGGFEIALACDIVLASQTASFGLPEPKVGLAALAGGIHRLPRQVGLKNAMAMLLTGRRVDAAEAYRIGICQEVVAPADLQARAMDWAREIAACAPLSVRATKQAALAGLSMPLEQAMSSHFDGLHRMIKSEDFIEGPRAFAEKRKPQWKGK